jgi:hypothetical protein
VEVFRLRLAGSAVVDTPAVVVTLVAVAMLVVEVMQEEEASEATPGAEATAEAGTEQVAADGAVVEGTAAEVRRQLPIQTLCSRTGKCTGTAMAFAGGLAHLASRSKLSFRSLNGDRR